MTLNTILACITCTFRRKETAMPLQVQLAKTDDVTGVPAQALIMPIMSDEYFTSPLHEQLRSRTDGYFHDLLGTLKRHRLLGAVPVVLFKDDRPERLSMLEYVAFAIVDDCKDTPYAIYLQALELLAIEGVRHIALPAPMDTMTYDAYHEHLKRLKRMIRIHRMTTLMLAPRRLTIAVDNDDALRLAMQKFGFLQCANTRLAAENS